MDEDEIEIVDERPKPPKQCELRQKYRGIFLKPETRVCRLQRGKKLSQIILAKVSER